MKGIEAARRWYAEAGAPMLARDFGEVACRIAAGIAGRGSECFGFDDEISADHDFETGFSLWITPEDERKFGFALERAYARLRRESPPPGGTTAKSALGGTGHGVVVIDEFFRRHIGLPGAPSCWQEWLYTPEHAFAEAVNGEVFRDDAGIFTGIRETIAHGMPEDVRRKKLAARAVMAAQSGQYNFARCLKHGEPGAAMLALAEFVRHAASLIHLLNRRFTPYYKWTLRSLRTLPVLGDTAEEMTALLSDGITGDKAERIDALCARIAAELRTQELSDSPEIYLEPHAFRILDGITSREIRSLHVMEG